MFLFPRTCWAHTKFPMQKLKKRRRLQIEPTANIQQTQKTNRGDAQRQIFLLSICSGTQQNAYVRHVTPPPFFLTLSVCPCSFCSGAATSSQGPKTWTLGQQRLMGRRWNYQCGQSLACGSSPLDGAKWWLSGEVSQQSSSVDSIGENYN